MSNQTLATEFQKVAHKLGELVAQYDELSEDEKKSTRHLIYKTTGGYGKALVKVFPDIRGVNIKLKEKKDAQEG